MNKIVADLKEAVQTKWNDLDNNLIKKLADNMDKRVCELSF